MARQLQISDNIYDRENDEYFIISRQHINQSDPACTNNAAKTSG